MLYNRGLGCCWFLEARGKLTKEVSKNEDMPTLSQRNQRNRKQGTILHTASASPCRGYSHQVQVHVHQNHQDLISLRFIASHLCITRATELRHSSTDSDYAEWVSLLPEFNAILTYIEFRTKSNVEPV